MHRSNKSFSVAAPQIVRVAERFTITAFFVLVGGVALYIATTGSLGIYYDYYLLPTYSLIGKLDYGAISVAQYLSALKSFHPHLQWFDAGALRFQPFYSNDNKLLMYIFDSPSALWAYRGISFALFNVVLYRITTYFCRSRLLAALVILLTLFPHAGYWYIWTTIGATSEGQAGLGILLCLQFYLLYLRQKNILLFCASMLFAVVALGFKETSFPAVGAFAGTHFLLSCRRGNRRELIASLLLIGTVAGMTVWYFFNSILEHLVQGGDTYITAYLRGAHEHGGLALLITNLRTYIATDPVLVFLLMPFAALQLWSLFRGQVRDEQQRITTAMIAGAIGWFFSLIMLGLANAHFQYFAVPAYCFALPAIANKLMNIFGQVTLRARTLPVQLLAMALIVLTFSPFRLPGQPSALSFFIDNRMDFHNLGKTITAAADIIKANEPKKTYFYFYHSPRNSSIEMYESFTAYLVARGFLPKNFDLAYSSPSDIAWSGGKVGEEFGLPGDPWSWRRNGQSRPMQSGDYMIVTSWHPFTSCAQINAVLAKFDLVYGTSGLLNCQPFNLRSILDYFQRHAKDGIMPLWRFMFADDDSEKHLNPLQRDCSPFTDRRNFYIFRKR